MAEAHIGRHGVSGRILAHVDDPIDFDADLEEFGPDWYRGAADRDAAMVLVHRGYRADERATLTVSHSVGASVGASVTPAASTTSDSVTTDTVTVHRAETDPSGAVAQASDGSSAVVPMSLVGLVAGFDPTEADPADLVAAIDVWDRVVSWATAGRSAAIAALWRHNDAPDRIDGPEALTADTLTAAEIGPLLALTTTQARRMVDDAHQLAAEPYARTRSALGDGRSDPYRAGQIAEELAGQPDDVVVAVHDALYGSGDESPDAREVSDPAAAVDENEPGSLSGAVPPISRLPDSRTLRRRIRNVLRRLHPDQAERERRRATQRRRVRLIPGESGMAWIEAYLPAEDAVAVKTCLDQIAVQLRDHDRATGAGHRAGHRHPGPHRSATRRRRPGATRVDRASHGSCGPDRLQPVPLPVLLLPDHGDVVGICRDRRDRWVADVQKRLGNGYGTKVEHL